MNQTKLSPLCLGLLAASCLLFVKFARCQDAAIPEVSPEVAPAPFDAAQAYKALCQKQLVDLSRVSHFHQLFELAKAAPKEANCPVLIQDAILMMGLAVEVSQNGDTCSSEHMARIADYHLKYMAHNSALVFSLPESLRKFFVAYAISTNKFCKENMARYLVSDTQKYLTPEDWTQIEEHIGKNTGNIFKELIDIAMDHILEWNLAATTENRAKNENELIYMETPNGDKVKRLQSICKRRFRPLYEKLVVPSISLSNLGYKFANGVQLDTETSNLLRKWNRVVYVCESMRDIVIVDNPEGKGQIVTYTRTEAEELKRKFGSKEPEGLDGRAQIVYQPGDESQPSDVLIDDSNVALTVDRLIQAANKYIKQFYGTPAATPKASANKNFFRFLFNRKALETEEAEPKRKMFRMGSPKGETNYFDSEGPLEDYF